MTNKPKRLNTRGPIGKNWSQLGSTIYAESDDTNTGGVICELSEPLASEFIQHHPLQIDSPHWEEQMKNAAVIVEAYNLLDLVHRFLESHANQEDFRTRNSLANDAKEVVRRIAAKQIKQHELAQRRLPLY